MGALDAMNLPETCPTCGADTPAGDWERWPVSPGVNLERELALARARIARLEARCKRLEEAGDKMADVLIWSSGVRYKQSPTASAWRKAKEAKP